VALMVAYALGIGLLFLILGTFSQLITRLPRSGPWMETVRGTLGYGMLFASIYLAAPHLDLLEVLPTLAPPATLIIVAIVAIGAGIGIGALHLSFHDGVRSHLLRKIAGMALLGLGAVLLIELLVAPPASASPLAWRSDHDQALADARAASKPVLIDFGAEWCAACKELEHKTFTTPEFAAAAQRFELVRIDCTELTDQVSALWERYGIQGLPNIVFIDSTGRALSEPRVTTFLPAQLFVAEMSKVR
jgi:thiol:disulfide interchange protein DsbD